MQYDWDEFLRPCIREIAGYTKTTAAPECARAFRFQRGPSGVAEMYWKPKAESGDWWGMQPVKGSPGLVNLRRTPRGVPVVIAPEKNVMKKKYRQQLLGDKVKSSCAAEGAPEAMKWLRVASKHGVLPIHRRLAQDGSIKPGDLGTEVEMKCGAVVATVQQIEAGDVDLCDEFWTCPQRHEQQAAAPSPSSQRHPCVGYRDVPVKRRPTYQGSDAQAVAEGNNDVGQESEGPQCAVALGDSDVEEVDPAAAEEAGPAAAEEAGPAEEGKDNESAHESNESQSSDSDEPLSNRPAVRAQLQAAQRSRSKRARPQSEEPAKEETYDVCAVFGKGSNGQAEVWLAIKLQCRRANYTRLQFLGALPDEQGKYVLMGESGTWKQDLVAHTFKDVVFTQKITYKAVRTGRGRGRKQVTTVTKEALDAAVLKSLEEKCAAEADEADEAHT